MQLITMLMETKSLKISCSIDHYVKQCDVQTVAMLCCAFGNRADNQEQNLRKNRSESGSVSFFLSFFLLITITASFDDFKNLSSSISRLNLCLK